MIEAVRYKNFKRYTDTALDLSKPLTVLVGPNSSGKSSLIKGLLAFKQTYTDPSDHAGFVAQGQYVDIGNFVEYSKKHDLKQEVTFVFSIKMVIPLLYSEPKTVFVEIAHENDPQTSHGRVLSYGIYISPDDNLINIKNYSDSDLNIKFKRMKKVEESFRIHISYKLFESVRKSYRSPGNLEQTYINICKQFKTGGTQAKRDNKRGMTFLHERPNDQFFEICYFIERYVLSPIHTNLFNAFTEKTFALASLREKPVRSMKLTDERQVVGPTGEHTAAVYHYLRQRAVKAGTRNSRFKDDYVRLDSWFKYMKLGTEIEINSWRDLIDLRTKTGSQAANSDSVVDVGVGFSQAAPILVQLAAMPDSSMLIVEQPELHLYPWSQTRLGEVLCQESARGRKRVVIETHSEHIIHGIQLHVSNVRAGKMSGLSARDVQIVYISSDSEISSIKLDEYGEFQSEWPDGFFDQTLQVYRTIVENRIS